MTTTATAQPGAPFAHHLSAALASQPHPQRAQLERAHADAQALRFADQASSWAEFQRALNQYRREQVAA